MNLDRPIDEIDTRIARLIDDIQDEAAACDAMASRQTFPGANVIPFPRPYRVHIAGDAERADIRNEELYR